MATKAEIRDAILRVAGNPVSGPIAALADAMADAVFEIDSAEKPKVAQPAKGTVQQREKETRVVEVAERR